MKTIARSVLTTEKRNPRSRDLDRRSTLEIVRIIAAEDLRVAPAVAKESRRIAAAADLIADRLRRGGRLLYAGAGTSGRLGVLDAAECPPTCGVPRTMVQGIIAGGRRALTRSAEGAEDSRSAGEAALRRARVGPKDAVVGIAASGITPFVHGAITQARRAGAVTVFVTCAPEARRAIAADIIIAPAVGPEVIAGSTRMKAGTATKLVLNALTTTAMVRLGKVHGNLMVDVRASNAKLRDRAERIVMAAAGATRAQARRLLQEAGGAAKVAILMRLGGVSAAEARRRLARADGTLRAALETPP